jgi:hypothetical protein
MSKIKTIPTWTLDGKINLGEVAAASEWHRQTTVDALVSLGVERFDAEAFADFIFSETAIVNGGISDVQDSRECVTEAQWDRIT